MRPSEAMTVSKNDLKFTRAEINLLLQNLDQLSDYEVQSLNDSLEELDRQEHRRVPERLDCVR
jgi:CBS-domain-containing membrane protein